MEKISEIPKLLSVKDMAILLGMHEKVIYRFTREGVFDDCLVRIGVSKTLRFNSSKVRECIDRGKFGNSQELTI